MVGVAALAQAPEPFVRILTPEMAAAREPQAVIEAARDAEGPAIAKINAALASPAEIGCNNTRLSDLVAQLKKRHKIEIQLDLPALKEAGVEPDCPVTKHLSGISLCSALRLVLDELQLTYVIHNEVLLITSPAKAESDDYMPTRLYPVKDLILVRNEHGEIETDFQALTRLDREFDRHQDLGYNGGTGTITPYQFQDRCLVVITQTQEVHEEIVDLLAALRRCGAADAKGGNELRLPKRPKAVTPPRCYVPAPQSQQPSHAIGNGPPVTGAGAAPQPPAPLVRILTPEMAASRESQAVVDAAQDFETPAIVKINAALASPTEIACNNTPLSDLVEQLKKRHKIEIQLDLRALKEAGVEPDCRVTKHLSGISLRSALRLLLDELQLKYVIYKEVLLITSPAKSESDDCMTTRLYLVKDLILVRNERGEIETDFQAIVDLIVNSIATRSWAENGGSGDIRPYQFQDRCLLAISQTQEVHEEIVNLLAALRRCGAGDTKGGNELRLPKRPTTVNPTKFSAR